MPTGALGESGLRTISSSMQMELSLCPLFQGNTGCQKIKLINGLLGLLKRLRAGWLEMTLSWLTGSRLTNPQRQFLVDQLLTLDQPSGGYYCWADHDKPFHIYSVVLPFKQLLTFFCESTKHILPVIKVTYIFIWGGIHNKAYIRLKC